MGDAVDRTVQSKGFPPKPGGGTPPPISSGSFVSWSGGKGRVDLVVKNGKVPGVDDDVEGTADSPAARVVVWEDRKPTRKKVAAKVATLKRIAPLTFGKEKKEPSVALMELVADHEQRIADGELPAEAAVSGRTVKAVFDRGVQAWPGEAKTTLTAEQWAVGRVEAFLTVAGGGEVKGYRRDADLLPAPAPAEHLHAPVGERVSIDPAELKAALAGFTE
jgi:hypothetical protein